MEPAATPSPAAVAADLGKKAGPLPSLIKSLITYNKFMTYLLH